MSVPVWPVTLPQILLVSGYQEGARDNNLRSAMDSGPAKVRRRATAAVRPVKGKLVMTAAQLEIFKSFYADDLLDGSLRFSWTEPTDSGTAAEMRFKEAPAWSAVDPGVYEVNMSLEILP